jgi:hypothetical protein
MLKPYSANGTSFQGYLTITYAELCQFLGDPHCDGDKTTAEWCFITDKGVVFTIYDYKTGSTPLGDYDWHVGGGDQEALEAVRELFPKHQVVR